MAETKIVNYLNIYLMLFYITTSELFWFLPLTSCVEPCTMSSTTSLVGTILTALPLVDNLEDDSNCRISKIKTLMKVNVCKLVETFYLCNYYF